MPEDSDQQDEYFRLLWPNKEQVRSLGELGKNLCEVAGSCERLEEKTVFAHPKAPLIDLLHEFDHVMQFEKEHQLKEAETGEDTPYIFTKLADVRVMLGELEEGEVLASWFGMYSNDLPGGSFEECFSSVENQLDGLVTTAWSGGEESLTRQLFNFLVPEDIQDRRLTKNQNDNAEVNAYTREAARYAEVGFSEVEIDEIKARIIENKPKEPMEDDDTLKEAFEFVSTQAL